tara:strand:+ start:8480 stop:9424 length:945 start_codon:yes stop_codon:yes gene_type:complete
VSDETVNEVDVQESAGSTGLLDDHVEAESVVDDQPIVDVQADDQPDASFNQVDARDFDPLIHEIDDEELKTDAFYDGITEHDIKELPTVARRMLHNFRVAYKMKQSELDRSHESRVSEYKKREQQIQQLERDFARRQAEWASIVEDPSIQDALKMSEEELPDIMSEDGINAHINRRVAEAMNNVFQPMQEASVARRQEAAFYDFLDAHPEMKNPAFKKEVASLVTERKNTDAPLSTQDAYEVVKARKIMAEQRSRTEKERRARAEAARRVQRSSMSGSPDAMQIPPDVKKQGAASIAAWLKSNPEAAKALSNYR